ncbi:hypothetical protein J3F83DRAFT_731865 [Trichoderma novae-zelandiae]
MSMRRLKRTSLDIPKTVGMPSPRHREWDKAIVQRLLGQVSVDEGELKNALFWAAAYGKDGVTGVLLERIPDVKGFQRPEHILCRAAASGLDNILAALIQAGHGINDPGPFWGGALAMSV